MEHRATHAWIEQIPLNLLREPLMWHFAEHYRLREFCKYVQTLAGSTVFDEAALEDIRHFLAHDLAWHVADEEDGLFPLLQCRCDAEDEVEKILDMLSADHKTNAHSANMLKALLSKALKEKRCLAHYHEAANIVSSFCRAQKHHVAIENAVVLPIARRRLTDKDLVDLGRKLADKRGYADPFASAE